MEPRDDRIRSWVEREVAGCQDWAATKAVYRFLSNARVDEEKILAGHFLCTQGRFAAIKDSPGLVLHDTTEFSYQEPSVLHRNHAKTSPGNRVDGGKTLIMHDQYTTIVRSNAAKSS